jgi:hypothetical protein
MTDDEVGPNPYAAFEAKVAELLASVQGMEPPPRLIFEAAQSVRPYIDNITAAMKNADLIHTADLGDRFAWLAVEVKDYPGPTAAELAGANKTLRTEVLPETSGAELEKAVSGIANDPKKVELAAFLTKLVESATGIPGSAPWVVFLIVFCVALKTDPDVVGAVALALAVFAMMQGKNG